MENILTGHLSKKLENDVLQIVNNQQKVIYEYLKSKGLNDEIDGFLFSGEKDIKSLWHNGSIFRYLLHIVQEQDENFKNWLKKNSAPYEVQEFKFEGLNLKVIEKSYLFDYLFAFFKHPDFDRETNSIHVGFPSEEERTNWYSTLENALKIVKENDEAHYQMLELYLDCISPVYLKNPLVKGNVISFTSNYSTGLIAYSHCPKILTAETLIHETRHNVLFNLMEKTPLFVDNSILVKTPLRDDLRPLSGLFHQAFVLCGLSRFYSKLLLNSEFSTMDNVIKRANLQFSDYTFSINILSENVKYFTTEGLGIFKAMQTDSKQHI
jgi:hypothetical protein